MLLFLESSVSPAMQYNTNSSGSGAIQCLSGYIDYLVVSSPPFSSTQSLVMRRTHPPAVDLWTTSPILSSALITAKCRIAMVGYNPTPEGCIRHRKRNSGE